jgi:protein ImuB
MGRLPMNDRAELYACLYAREFPAQALLRLRPELRAKAFVVMEGEPPLQSVCSLNSKARSLGIVRGMTKVEIDTFPLVITLLRSLPEETATKTALVECAGSFSPRIEDRSSNNAFLCVIDIAGTEKLFGSPRTLAQNLLGRVRALGISASATVSSNFHTATCLARGRSGSDVTITAPGQEGAALAQLPVSVLNLSEDHAETFTLWGIHTLGMLASLPEKELIARMGQEGKRLRQLARGQLPHLFVPLEPEFTLQEQIELDNPVELLDSLLFVIGVMLEQIIIRATTRVLALASVTITLSLEGGASHTRTVRPALPCNDKQLWIKLLHLDLETHPPQAPVLSLKLSAESGSTSKVQLGLFSPQLPEPMRLDVTLARIRAIVGEDCVGRPVLKDTHQPDAFRIEPFTVSSTATSAPDATRTTAAMRQLRPAESVSVTLCGERPIAFSFRQKRYDIEHAYGPWAAGGEWWNPTLWSLEQWDLVARSQEGLMLCCCLVCDLSQNIYQMVALYD